MCIGSKEWEGGRVGGSVRESGEMRSVEEGVSGSATKSAECESGE